MNRKSPSKSERYFSTGLTMITSRGTNGPNVMTAEWVMQISYQPVLIGAFIHEGSQTLKNIEKTKEFGINVASQKQTTEVNIAGGYSGTELDKLKIKSIFKLVTPQKIKTPLISGCTINAECKLVRKQKLGDHVMVVGKVVYIRHDDSKTPLIYHSGRYFGLDSGIEQDRVVVNVHKDTLKYFKNIAQKKFVVKCVGVLVESKNKILVISKSKTMLDVIPFSVPLQGVNQRNHLIEFLKNTELDIQVGKIPIMKRLILKNGKDIQRINFVLFHGKNLKSSKVIKWKYSTDNRLISALV
ncbi:MAG: flavin reductase family protein [Nitrosotalea sp.]